MACLGLEFLRTCQLFKILSRWASRPERVNPATGMVLQYPTLRAAPTVGVVALPARYPGETAHWGMSREYYRHHKGWTSSSDFRDQIRDLQVTAEREVWVRSWHDDHMAELARLNGFDAVSCFNSLSSRLLRRDEESRPMTI